MADTRELILARMLVTLATVSGVQTAVRNRGLLSNEKRDAIVLCDGDETVKLLPGRSGRGPVMLTTSINTMRPELYVLLKEGRVNNIDVGQHLNAYRIAVCAALSTDTELEALLGAEGGITYNGCVTDLKSGSSLSGEMRLDFAISYVFNP